MKATKKLVKPMSRNVLFIIPVLFVLLTSLSCGGMAQNPTQPGFQPPNQPGAEGAEGAEGEGGILDQLSGAGDTTGEQIISGTFEMLWPQGLEAMEEGDMMLAAQYFKSAFAQNPQSADAALAYALTDVMRDFRRYAVFLHPGVDRLFANTPLIGHPEIFPNAFLAEDSYMLRLAALGKRASNVNTAVFYPVLAPIETESMFLPENFQQLQMMANPEDRTETPPEPGIPGEDAGESPVTDETGDGTDTESGEETPSEDGSSTSPPPFPAQPPPDPDERGTSADDPSKLNPHNQKGPDDDGATSGITDPSGGTGTFEGGFPGGIDHGQMGGAFSPLAEREEPIGEDEWEAWISEYRNAAARDGADMLLSEPFYSNLRQFHNEIEEHITNMESVRTIIETEGYSLSLPFNVLDGNQKVTLQFDVDDYHILLDHYRLIDVILSYHEAYSTMVTFVLPTANVEDRDTDAIFRPDEYIPDAPFGMLKNDGVQVLGFTYSSFLQALSNLNNTMVPLLSAAQEIQVGDPEMKELFYLSSFHRNFVLIEQWNDLLRDITDKSTSGHAIKLASGPNVVDVVVVYDSLFNNPMDDIRTPLPSFNAVTGEVILDEENNWSADPTFGGLFPEGLTDPDTYLTSGRMATIVYAENMSKAEGMNVNIGMGSGEVNDKGLATISNVTVNELIGTSYTIADESGAEVGSGMVRTLSEVLMLFDVEILIGIIQPAIGQIESYETSPDGETMIMGPDGTMIETGVGGWIPGSGESDEGGTQDDDGSGNEDEEKEDNENGGDGDEDEEPEPVEPNEPGVGGDSLA